MVDISNNENQSEHFAGVMKKRTDDELVNILRNRKKYQPEAAKQAVLEAIARGIINSEQDLFSEKFAEDSSKTALFPTIENPVIRKKLRRSISRSLALVGAIPLVWCIVRWNVNSLLENISVIFYSVLWIGIAIRLYQTNDLRLARGLLILFVPGLVYFVRLMLKNPFPLAYEILVPVVLTALIFYGVGFLRKLKD